jgi:hypothetical protein
VSKYSVTGSSRLPASAFTARKMNSRRVILLSVTMHRRHEVADRIGNSASLEVLMHQSLY